MPTENSHMNQFFNYISEPPSSHTSIEVHRVLITIYRIHLINLFLSLPALLLHCAVLSYSIFKEKSCDKPFIAWLIVVTSISTARIIPQCILISRAATLLAEWSNRPVALDTSLLAKSLTAHLDRLLWIFSIVWFFLGFEWAYSSINCNILAPILYQYVTILILFFLAMLGMNCLLCMGSSTLLFLACVLPTQRFVLLFEDQRHQNLPMRSDYIKMMPILKWSSDLKAESESSKMCPICLIEYENGHKLRQLPCGHCFHQVCIDQWFKTNSTCPLRCHFDVFNEKSKFSSFENTSNSTTAFEMAIISSAVSVERSLPTMQSAGTMTMSSQEMDFVSSASLDIHPQSDNELRSTDINIITFSNPLSPTLLDDQNMQHSLNTPLKDTHFEVNKSESNP